MVPFSFAGEEWRLVAPAALYWPRENALLVADLHLEKASWFAELGQPLPPYDSRETLERVAAAIRDTGARRVLCLGDSFHDSRGPARLEPHAAGMLDALVRATDWVWIGGNHEGFGAALPGGTALDELEVSGVVLRHEARPGEVRPELSGHFHPRLRLTVRGRSVVRRCVVASERKLVLPALGAFTGGLDAADPALIAALQPAQGIDALVAGQGRVLRFPIWRNAA